MSLQCMGTARLCSSQFTGRSGLGAMSTALMCGDVLPSGQAGTEMLPGTYNHTATWYVIR